MPQQERRLVNQLIDYWRDLKGEEALPKESYIDPKNVQDIWDDCFLLQVDQRVHGRGLHYSYLGSGISKVLKGENSLDQQAYDKLSCTKSSDIGKRVLKVIDNYEPLIDEGEFVSQEGITVKYRRCFVPLAKDNDDLGYVLGGIRWKAFT